jgi:iron complex transport system substrate-binding protein
LRKKAVFIIWPEPLIVAGPATAIDDTLRLLGWENIASDVKTRYPKYSIEELLHRRPDVILIGKGHIDMREVSKGLLKKLHMLDAVKEGRVYFVSDALYRLGPRVLEGIEELHRILNQASR